MSMNVKAYFETVGVPATGLTPTVNIRDLATGTLAISAGVMIETGDGYYTYEFVAYDYSVTYSILCDGGAGLAATDRYVVGEFINAGTSSSSTGTSIVGLCNQALFMLGQKSIISMLDDNEAARLCNGRYVYNRDATIRAYPWNCAQVRVELARSTVVPDWGYSYKYALPTVPLCLRVLSMEEAETGGYKWKIEGRWLVTDSLTAHILYLAQLTDVNDMEILLKEAIASRLAADICYALTGSSTQQDKMWALFQAKIREAKSVDAQEGIPETMTYDPFLDARL